MPDIGRKIYYEKLTENIIVDTGERSGNVIETTQEQDFELYAELAARVPETVGVIQLRYGQYREDFIRSKGLYNINQINESFSVEVTGEYDEESGTTSLKPTNTRYDNGCEYATCTVNGEPIDISEVDKYGNVTVPGEVIDAVLGGIKTVEIEFPEPDPNNPDAPPVYTTPLTEQIAQLREQLNPKNPDEIFRSLDYENTDIEDLKVKKINQLDYLCNQDILAGFESNALGVVHQYKSGYDDQINTIGTLTLINADPTIETVEFKTSDAGYLVHSREQFHQVYKDGETFKRNKMARYDTLKAQVQSETIKSYIISVVW